MNMKEFYRFLYEDDMNDVKNGLAFVMVALIATVVLIIIDDYAGLAGLLFAVFAGIFTITSYSNAQDHYKSYQFWLEDEKDN